MSPPCWRRQFNLRSFAVRFGVCLMVALVPLAIQLFTSPPASNPRAQAVRLARELDRLLQIRLREVFTIAAFPSMRAYAASDPAARAQRAAVALNEMQAWVAADPQVREVFIVDLQASMLLGTGKVDRRAAWGVRRFIKNALAGQLDVSAPSRDGGEFSQYYVAPILNNGGEVAGALVVRVAAQEMWEVFDNAGGESNFAVLVDENGVRLAESGDAKRTLVAFAPLTVEQQARLLSERTYGAEVTSIPTTNFVRAQALLTAGALDQLTPADFGAEALGAQRLLAKPWYVIVLDTRPSFARIVQSISAPLIGAVVAALLAIVLMSWVGVDAH